MIQQYPQFGQYMVTGYVEVGIWKRVGGVWSLAATESVQIYQDVGSQGYHTVGWNSSNTYALGAGVEAFGVTIQNSDAGPSNTSLSSIYASWAVNQASGERSATPSGQQTTIIVRPI